MKSISTAPYEEHLIMTDVPEPGISSDYDIKLKVLQVGISGLDRQQVLNGSVFGPQGKTSFVIGHEMLGVAVETGNKVQDVKRGDYGVFTVRRGCGECSACLNNRNDMCYTGKYTERGINGVDGFQAEYVVDHEEYFIKVPESCKDIGVLIEPMAVAVKAIEETLIIQGARMKNIEDSTTWLKGKKMLVAGLGPVGLMAAFVFRLKGAKVTGLDFVDPVSLRAQIIKNLRCNYVDGSMIPSISDEKDLREFDFIFETERISRLKIQLTDALANNGIYILAATRPGNSSMGIMTTNVMRQFASRNQVLLGSVSASKEHYGKAANYLLQSQEYWPGLISKVITNKFSYTDFQGALSSFNENSIMEVINWE